jgi:homoaconitase/3-isopropylmalate dehydratase large subunit
MYHRAYSAALSLSCIHTHLLYVHMYLYVRPRLQTPATMKFALNGAMPDYLLAKDIILQIIGDIGVAGATYRCAHIHTHGDHCWTPLV